MKEICIDARLILNSGIGTYLRNLLIRLKSAPFRITLILPKHAVAKLEWLSSFELIFSDLAIYSLQEQAALPFLVPRCDLFWSPHLNMPLFPIRAKRRLVTIHDVFPLAFFSLFGPVGKAYAKLLFLRAKIADQIITVSQFSKEELLKYTSLSSSKIASIHSGVDRTHFTAQVDTMKIEEFKKKRALPEKFILFVGNLKIHKNLRGLVDAYRHLVMRGYADHALVVVGSRVNMRNVEEPLALIGNDAFFSRAVRFLDNIEDEELPLLYQSAKLTVLPSFYEGFGLTPLEAMSCGCPVVVSRVASLPEVCGDAVEYVNPYDAFDIARGIEQVLKENPQRETLIKRGLERCDKFSWDKTAQQHLKVIEETLQK